MHLLVDATGTRRKLQALQALGWPLDVLAARLGCTTPEVRHIIRQTQVGAVTRDRVDALYERLSGTPGPSDQTRDAARTAGWATPLAWHDVSIDDPDARPDPGTTTRRPGGQPRVDLEEVAFLLWCGESMTGVAAALRVQPASIHRARHRRRAETGGRDPELKRETAG